jgi:transcriptional regulator with XRE-family HTH domain
VTDRQILRVIGANVRKARLQADMTQECLAELVDVHWQSISYLENGRHPLLLTKFARISQALDVSPDRLFDGLPEPEKSRSENIRKALARKRRARGSLR